MLRKDIQDSVKGIKNTHVRLNIQILLFAVLSLGSVIVFQNNINTKTETEKVDLLKERIIYLRDKLKECEHSHDSILLNIQMEREETIKKLNGLIINQNNQKNIVR